MGRGRSRRRSAVVLRRRKESETEPRRQVRYQTEFGKEGGSESEPGSLDLACADPASGRALLKREAVVPFGIAITSRKG